MMERPNIILINCDDLGFGDLGCYGSQVNQSPQIDALARDGLRLESHYVMSPFCSASRAALLTGCYPERIGFGPCNVLRPGHSMGLHPQETTLARYLKWGGYATKLIGKWHCGDQPEFLPTRHGFDSWFGLPYSNDMGLMRFRGKDNERYCPLPLMRDEEVIAQQPDQQALTERYSADAVDFIRQNRGRPFFLYFAHMHVHLPLYVPKPFLDASRNGAYGAAVACIDWSTGVLMHQLRELGLEKNTIVIFTSDNGSRARGEGGSNSPFRGTKGTTWEGGQRVPCLIRWPGRVPAGRVSDGISRSVDLLPTLCRWAGVPCEPELPMDGVDLSALYQGQTEASPNEVMAYYLWHRLEAIRLGDWKWRFSSGTPERPEPCEELYNLRDDPGESLNRFKECPEVIERMVPIAEDFRARLGDVMTGRRGSECRPIGAVDEPRKLTVRRDDDPYLTAEYDLADSEVLAG